LDQVYEAMIRWRDLERFRPFVLLAAQAQAAEVGWGLRVMWDGQDAQISRVDPPFAEVSSSVDAAAVEASRRAELATLLGDAGAWSRERVDAVFGGHAPQRGAASMCMHRDDASTVSHTRIEVTPERVALTYYDGPLCEAPEGVRLELARAL
jgi:hypothetical protein